MTKNRIDIGDMVFLYTSLSYLKIDQSLSDVAIASIPNALRYMELTKATRLEATIPYGDLPDHNKIFTIFKGDEDGTYEVQVAELNGYISLTALLSGYLIPRKGNQKRIYEYLTDKNLSALEKNN